MIALVLAAAFGTLAGLLSALPGLHISILLIGALPLLGVNGPVGAVVLVTAIGSGLIASNLAKTFHPATADTIRSATPEQILAYRGDGLKAVGIQHQAVWAGVLTVLMLAAVLLPLRTLIGTGFAAVITMVTGWLVLPLLLLFTGLVVRQAKHKLPTVAVIILATGLGFYTLNCAALTGNHNALAPLLGGGFALPALAMVVLHRGRVQPFPKQRVVNSAAKPAPEQVWGALGGIATALTAGLGSGGAVSVFADQVNHEEYLGMHTASEAANHVFAVLLFILVGTTHSGTGVALRQQLVSPGLAMSLLLLVALALSTFVAHYVAQQVVGRYVSCIGRIPQRSAAMVITVVTLALLFTETGLAGIAVAIAAAALGWCAKTNFVPNQAMTFTLTGPVLVYHLGLSGWLASVLHVLH
jgi:TctA family transporter